MGRPPAPPLEGDQTPAEIIVTSHCGNWHDINTAISINVVRF